MRLYLLRVLGRWHYVGTQADARAQRRETGVAWEEVEVPVAKPGLIAFLNTDASTAPAPPAVPPEPAPVAIAPSTSRPAPPPIDAASVLARMDNPGVDLDTIVETIARMKGGYALKRIAGAVAIRFEELSR